MTKQIITQQDYPKEGIRYYNLENILGSPELFTCIKIMARYLYIDTNDIFRVILVLWMPQKLMNFIVPTLLFIMLSN